MNYMQTSDFQFTKHSPHSRVLCSFLFLIVSLGAFAKDEKLSWKFSNTNDKRDVHIDHHSAILFRDSMGWEKLFFFKLEANNDAWWIMRLIGVEVIRKHNCQFLHTFHVDEHMSLNNLSLTCMWNYIMHATHLNFWESSSFHS